MLKFFNSSSIKVCVALILSLVPINLTQAAELYLEDGTVLTNHAEISAKLDPFGSVSYWPMSNDLDIQDVLNQDSLTDIEKKQLLTQLEPFLQEKFKQAGYYYQGLDMVVINPQTPDTEFPKPICHTHSDDELRYNIDGEGIFVFVFPNGSQARLKIEKNDILVITKGAQHWFEVTPKRTIKLVRFYTSKNGWTPIYSCLFLKEKTN
jgi:1,2-dihydroxy-3-keto-5-methylthiopentene dioxygenase